MQQVSGIRILDALLYHEIAISQLLRAATIYKIRRLRARLAASGWGFGLDPRPNSAAAVPAVPS